MCATILTCTHLVSWTQKNVSENLHSLCPYGTQQCCCVLPQMRNINVAAKMCPRFVSCFVRSTIQTSPNHCHSHHVRRVERGVELQQLLPHINVLLPGPGVQCEFVTGAKFAVGVERVCSCFVQLVQSPGIHLLVFAIFYRESRACIHQTNLCIKCVLMRVWNAMKKTTADVLSVNPLPLALTKS